MKKYFLLLSVLLLSLSTLLGGCTKTPDDSEDDENPKEEFKAELINSTHKTSIDDEEILPYIVIRTNEQKENEEYFFVYSLTFFSSFPKVNITNRLYKYYQVDYSNANTKQTYYHIFDEIDGVERSYAQNFIPSYKTTSLLKELQTLVKYSFNNSSNINIEKEINFKENIIEFSENEFENFEENSKYNFSITKEKREDENFNRIKLNINLDEEVKTGHYDIQTWIEDDGRIIPFVGYYHYRASLGNIASVSDEIVKTNVNKIYLKISYYLNEKTINIYKIYNM